MKDSAPKSQPKLLSNLQAEVVVLLEELLSCEGDDGCLALTKRGTQCRNRRSGNRYFCSAHQKHPPKLFLLPFGAGETLSDLVQAVKVLGNIHTINRVHDLKHQMVCSDVNFRRGEPTSPEGAANLAVLHSAYACTDLAVVQKHFELDPELKVRQEQVNYFAPQVTSHCQKAHNYLRVARDLLQAEIGF